MFMARRLQPTDIMLSNYTIQVKVLAETEAKFVLLLALRTIDGLIISCRIFSLYKQTCMRFMNSLKLLISAIATEL